MGFMPVLTGEAFENCITEKSLRNAHLHHRRSLTRSQSFMSTFVAEEYGPDDSDAIGSEGGREEGMRRAALRLAAVHVVTAADVAAGTYGIADVVLPLPGSRVRYPDHSTAEVRHLPSTCSRPVGRPRLLTSQPHFFSHCQQRGRATVPASPAVRIRCVGCYATGPWVRNNSCARLAHGQRPQTSGDFQAC